MQSDNSKKDMDRTTTFTLSQMRSKKVRGREVSATEPAGGETRQCSITLIVCTGRVAIETVIRGRGVAKTKSEPHSTMHTSKINLFQLELYHFSLT